MSAIGMSQREDLRQKLLAISAATRHTLRLLDRYWDDIAFNEDTDESGQRRVELGEYINDITNAAVWLAAWGNGDFDGFVRAYVMASASQGNGFDFEIGHEEEYRKLHQRYFCAAGRNVGEGSVVEGSSA